MDLCKSHNLSPSTVTGPIVPHRTGRISAQIQQHRTTNPKSASRVARQARNVAQVRSNSPCPAASRCRAAAFSNSPQRRYAPTPYARSPATPRGRNDLNGRRARGRLDRPHIRGHPDTLRPSAPAKGCPIIDLRAGVGVWSGLRGALTPLSADAKHAVVTRPWTMRKMTDEVVELLGMVPACVEGGDLSLLRPCPACRDREGQAGSGLRQRLGDELLELGPQSGGTATAAEHPQDDAALGCVDV